MKHHQEQIERHRELSRDINKVFASMETLGVRIGLAVVISAFVLYLTNILPPVIPIADLITLVSVDASTFTSTNHIPVGWAWLRLMGHGDILSLAGIMVLLGSIFLAYLALIPLCLRRKDFIYLALVIVQLAVFVLAGGGWITAGH
ncbi:MAG: hypothetical protein OEW39_04735 [Deltaproteobacteria bacterium]|nr:hypothetical protein [Deltaproteobacteria bacterium]